MKRTIDQRHLSNLRRISRLIGLADILIGVIVLIAWRFQWENVKRISAQFPAMTPNTAIALVMLGAALLWDINRRPPMPRSIASLAAGIALLFISFPALYENTYPETRLWVNHALVDLLTASFGEYTEHPQIPASSTAFCLISLASSLIVIRARPTLAQALILPSMFVSFAALVSEIFLLMLDHQLFGIKDAPAMAVHTATALFFTAFGFLASFPQGAVVWRLFDKSPSGDAIRILGFSLLSVPIMLALASMTVAWLPEGYAVQTYTALLTLVVAVFVLATVMVIRQLDRSEGRFYQVMEQAGDGIFLADLNGRYTDVNPAAWKMLGYSSESELLDKKIVDLLDPMDWPRLDAARFQLLRPGTTHREEWRLKHKDGHMVPVEICSNIVPGGAWQATVRDITDRKIMEDQLRFFSDSAQQLSECPSYEERLQKIASVLVPKLADYCMVFSKDGDSLKIKAVAHVDPGKAELLVQTGRESPPILTGLIGNLADKSAELIILETVTDETYRQIAKNESHYQRLKEIGTSSYLTSTLVAHGRIIGTVSLGMTGKARPLRKKDEGFFSEVIHRLSMALDNSRLYSEALSAVRAREDILAIVSHDLKNPISAIDLTSQVALMRVDSGSSATELKEFFATIRQTNFRMKRLVDMLLNVGKLQSRTFVANRRAMSLHSLFKDTEEAFSALAKRNSVELAFQAPEDDEIDADFGALSQAVSNLVSNAIKFSPPQSTIEIIGTFSPLDQVVISVTDHGRGIPVGCAEKLFERYWQADASRKEGAGLGLFIVKGVVEAHGGTVSVSSKPGEGSKFTIQFPRSARTAESVIPQAQLARKVRTRDENRQLEIQSP